MEFFTRGSIIIDYKLVFWLEVTVKLKHPMDLFLTNIQLFTIH